VTQEPWRPPDPNWQPPDPNVRAPDPAWRPAAVPVPQVAAPPPGYTPPQVAAPPGYPPPPVPYPPATPPPSPGARALRPSRIDPVPGTHFGIAYPDVRPTVSGLAVGSMVAGIGSCLVSLLVLCFGLVGAQRGWGPLVAGAFTVLAVAVGGGALGAALVANRQIRRSAGEITGRGLAITGLACGSAGAGLGLLGLLLAAALAAGSTG
jgi:hypothetical protein